MHLYELSERFKNIQNTIENDGESFDEQTLRTNLMEVTLLFEEKVESIAKIMKGLESQQTAYKNESDRLAQKAKSAQNKYDWLKNYLTVEMINAKQDKVDGLILKVALQKNSIETVNILDASKIPHEFCKHEPEKWIPDKSLVLKSTKSTGVVPDGAEVLVGLKHLVIK
jgi:hypothetical protein